MAIEPYIGQIQAYAFGFAPKGWALCNGQLLAINTNSALFSLIGTTYGGNGVTNFALPDLRGRSAVHYSTALALGAKVGTEAETLTGAQTPPHAVSVSSQAALSVVPAGKLPAPSATVRALGPGPANAVMGQTAASSVGGNQPHNNMPPFLTLNYCISLSGVFPSRP